MLCLRSVKINCQRIDLKGEIGKACNKSVSRNYSKLIIMRNYISAFLSAQPSDHWSREGGDEVYIKSKDRFFGPTYFSTTLAREKRWGACPWWGWGRSGARWKTRCPRHRMLATTDRHSA